MLVWVPSLCWSRDRSGDRAELLWVRSLGLGDDLAGHQGGC